MALRCGSVEISRKLAKPPVLMNPLGMGKQEQYAQIQKNIAALIEGERDEICVLSTVVCELHNGMALFDWTGFYRVVSPGVLKVGPYQGTHGCLTIPFIKGVCGKCAREAKTQIVPDVTKLPYHIACSSTTKSEIVVPVLDEKGQVRAVLDIDSNTPNAFDEVDAQALEEICSELTRLYSAARSAGL
jgi:GAF domain-containing protein